MLPIYAVHHRVVVAFCVLLIVLGGLWSYKTLGRLEDPEFSIRTALVVTVYKGASAKQVEERVSNVIERAVQQIKGFEKVRSISKPDLSIVLVDLKESFDVKEMPNSWQELRNKVALTRLELPPEALPPIVKDDFGDVYGIVFALTGEGFSDAELRDRAKELQKEFLLVDQVRRVELWGVPEERIEVEISQARMKELGIHPLAILLALQSQNLTTDAGEMTISGERIRLAPTGTWQSLEEIGDILIPDGRLPNLSHLADEIAQGKKLQGLVANLKESRVTETRQIRLRDIATIRRVLNEEPSRLMRSNGKRAIAIALSPLENGDVIRMGKVVREKLDSILETWPVGFQADVICYQPDNVNVSIRAFTKNLYEAIVIVTFVVMLAMGVKSGLLITSSLLIVILGTFCVMLPMGIVLQRTSLGALIVALGILVDDAVVVGDLILVRMQRGMDRTQACIEGAQRASHQLLGATIVGALAFWPIYLSTNMTGQYAGSLFLVVGASLMISWFVAMLQTPVVYHLFVRPKADQLKDPHGGPIFRGYRRLLELTLHHKTIVLGLLLCLFVLTGYGFSKIPQIFFPKAQRSQFMIDFWLPEGTSINKVSEDIKRIEEHLLKQDGITNTGSFIGGGPPRFYLPYEPELPNSSYAQIVVNVKSLDDIDRLISPIEHWLQENFPQAESRVQRFALGPTTKLELEARISGPDSEVLRNLAEQAKEILQKDPNTKFVRDNWRQKIPTWAPEFSQAKGSRAMVSRSEMLFALNWATKGLPVATFGDGETLLPVIVRSTPNERNSTDILDNTPVWGHSLENVPLSRLIEKEPLRWEEGQIHRRNRIPTITVGCDAHNVDWSKLMKELRPKLEELHLPNGYQLEWGGQYEESHRATKELLRQLPIALILMAIIVVALFNSFRQPLIILITFPLAAIGITFGMLLFRMPFGFMALVGAMSLLGMMVRNGVVLMDQIDEELKKGEEPYQAIVDASVERMRPVTVAALTVIVGMIPLLRDPLFDSMATAIMFGLIFATVLTLFVVPILYMIFFRVSLPEKKQVSRK